MAQRKIIGRRPVVVATLAVAILAVATGPVLGITYGERDADNKFSSVGMVIFSTPISPGFDLPVAACSGTLIAPDAVLTAGHCTDIPNVFAEFFPAGISVGVSFEHEHDNLFDALANAVPGQPENHPDYDGFASFPNSRDLGIVWLDGPAGVEVQFTLPDEHQLDALATGQARQQTELTVVGYGLQHSQVVGADTDVHPPELEFDDTWDFDRWVGTVKIVNTRNAFTGGFNLQHTGNPGQGGGTCFGDSGGPVLHGDTIFAVSSFGIGNPMCRGNTGFAYRLDISDALDWLDSLDLP